MAWLASLAWFSQFWLSVRLRTKWLWVRIPLLSLNFQIWGLLLAKSFLTFRQSTECWFTLKLVRDMIITDSQTKLVRKNGYPLPFVNVNLTWFLWPLVTNCFWKISKTPIKSKSISFCECHDLFMHQNLKKKNITVSGKWNSRSFLCGWKLREY